MKIDGRVIFSTQGKPANEDGHNGCSSRLPEVKLIGQLLMLKDLYIYSACVQIVKPTDDSSKTMMWF